MQKIGFGKWGCNLSTKSCCFLGDAVKFPPKAADLVKGARRGRVKVHGRRSGEAVMQGVIGVTTDQFPCPEDLYGLICGGAKGVSNRTLNG